jgi:prepilin-type N-terminal cleavage/methylation domain-containing protein
VNRNSSNKGFSLVELLAVVLVLAALAAIAVPLYTSQRKSAQARVCLANLSAITASLSAYALRNNQYPSDTNLGNNYNAATPTAATSGLVGAPEGLASMPTCPSTAAAYVYTPGTQPAACTIACPNPGSHTNYAPSGAVYTITLAAPGADSLP